MAVSALHKCRDSLEGCICRTSPEAAQAGHMWPACGGRKTCCKQSCLSRELQPCACRGVLGGCAFAALAQQLPRLASLRRGGGAPGSVCGCLGGVLRAVAPARCRLGAVTQGSLDVCLPMGVRLQRGNRLAAHGVSLASLDDSFALCRLGAVKQSL